MQQQRFLFFLFSSYLKSEIRNSKSEINLKSQFSNDQNNIIELIYSPGSFWSFDLFVIRICFEFRISIFGLKYPRSLAVNVS